MLKALISFLFGVLQNRWRNKEQKNTAVIVIVVINKDAQ